MVKRGGKPSPTPCGSRAEISKKDKNGLFQAAAFGYSPLDEPLPGCLPLPTKRHFDKRMGVAVE